MNRREFFRSVGWGAVSLAFVGRARGVSAEEKPLNFVFILVDDLGWKDLGCYGSTFYETRNVDRLAAQGMRFTDAYAACPVCSPTRASIVAGKYPARLDTTDWFGAPQPEESLRSEHFGRLPLLPPRYVDRLPLEEETMAEAFKSAGYRTLFAGKWHLGEDDFYPEDQGFDINRGGFEAGFPWGGYFSPYKNPKLKDGPEDEHLPDRLARETAKFIEKSKDRPFMAYLSFYSVHTPLMAREDLRAKYKEKAEAVEHFGPAWGKERERKVRLVQDHAVYGGMVEAMDQAVGKVLGKLRELGLEQNTAIVLMSDNGGVSTSEGHPTSNLPLRAGKGWLYEGGIREPMIVRWPGVTVPGSTCSVPVTSTDFYPTMLEMAGLPAKPDQHVDGVSLAPLLRGAGSLDRDALYWHYPHYGNQGGAPGGAVRQGDWKLIEWYEDGRLELFNLREDIGERNNLAQEEPDRVRELHVKLKAWRRQINAKMPTPNPNLTHE